MNQTPAKPITNALCVDVDDLSGAFSEGGWAVRNPRCEVAGETEALLESLAEAGLQATFFAPGHFVAAAPELVRRIADEGHELASHGTVHCQVYNLTPEAFREDVRASRARLEDLSGRRVDTYKAPIWSITPSCLWAYDELAEAGYRVDHSATPPVVLGLGRELGSLEPFRHTSGIGVVPVTSLRLGSRMIPLPGGFYNAWLPWWWLRGFYRRLNQQGVPFNFYFHPFEHSPSPTKKRVWKHGSLYISLYAAHAGRYEPLLRRISGDFGLGTLADAYSDWLAPWSAE